MMKEFDLELALKGEPVKTRDGNKAFVQALVSMPKELEEYVLVGYVRTGKYVELAHWNKAGKYVNDVQCDEDIVGMWEEPKPKRFINGIEVPESVTLDTFINAKEYWFVDLENTDFINKAPFYNFNSESLNLLNRGLVFMRKEETEAMAKALFNYKVETK
ncbi:Uncharacterised protein [uncultured Avibacterium sp.]|uniref:Uncharacterized protein n=1 Tax=uncultured Avibacterium sp. TaxID=1936169 RepID=A0A486XC01_9PAST|nr:Uncharacterised protein [uncultured Avibacterium sp.]